MNRAALILAACLASGCASVVEAPRIEVFAKAAALPPIDMPAPATLPARPVVKHLRDPAAGDLFAFDGPNAQKLVARDQVCEANTDVATHCAAGFKHLQLSYDALLREAQLLEGQHNYMAQRWAQAETELRQRERERAIESWLTRLLLAGALIAASD